MHLALAVVEAFAFAPTWEKKNFFSSDFQNGLPYNLDMYN